MFNVFKNKQKLQESKAKPLSDDLSFSVPKKIDPVCYIYADGGCRRNGRADSVGGYGVVIEHEGHVEEYYGVECGTTNNIMELLACIKALELITNTDIPISLTTDSKYVVLGVNIWRYDWESNGWVSKAGNTIKNKDLWIELFYQVDRFKDITIHHCYGHKDNVGNNRADELANKAMDLVDKF